MLTFFDKYIVYFLPIKLSFCHYFIVLVTKKYFIETMSDMHVYMLKYNKVFFSNFNLLKKCI